MTKAQEKAAMPAAKQAVIEAARKRVAAKKQAAPQTKSTPSKPAAPAKKKNKLLEIGKKFMGGMQNVRDASIKKALKKAGV